jgi:hypothetical protein
MPRIAAISLTGIGFSFSVEIDRWLISSAKRGSNFSSIILSINGRNATSRSSGFSNDIIYFKYYCSNTLPTRGSVIDKNNKMGLNENNWQIIRQLN